VDPLIGAAAIDTRSTSLGRLRVMCSRNRASLAFIHDGRWPNLLEDADIEDDTRAKALAVREALTA
jgi:hypothetical protein